jgi:hypothetical protein
MEWTLMNRCGQLIGLAAEELGILKDAEGLIIEEHIWMSIKRIQGNIPGLIGEFRLISKKFAH